MRHLLEPQKMRELMRVALGDEWADLVVVGGDVVDVYTRELLPNHSIAVKDRWIAYVGQEVDHIIGPQTEVIDASGKVVVPGFIDAHAHMVYYHRPDEFLRYAIRSGTTTIITEIMELAFPMGYEGLLAYIDALRDQPIRVLFTVPPSIALSRSLREKIPTVDQLLELLQREEAVGVGEGYWQEVLRGDPYFPVLSARALRLGKVVEGHAAGCRGRKLAAYLAFGVSSCHEAVNAQEALERLRMGLWVMVREGSIRRELEAVAPIKDMSVDLRRMILVSDGLDPRDIIEKGYMDFILQKAIDLGFDPLSAIQMVTLNPAEHFRLDGLTGGIAPGRCADIVIIRGVKTIEVECVISSGRVIMRDGQLKVNPRRANLPKEGLGGITVDATDFTIEAKGKGARRVRVIEQVTELVTKEALVDLFPWDGQIKADPERDLLKVSLVNWQGRVFTGLIRGLGMREGALATSAVWENAGVVVVGANEEDMARATNRVFELGGGIVLVARGQRLAELPLPVGGMISDLPIEGVARRLKEIQEEARKLGFRFPDAPLTLATLPSPAIPFLRISEDGLVDLKKGEIVSLMVW